MSESKVRFYPRLPSTEQGTSLWGATNSEPARLEPATCTEAEPFALRVLDDSMLPEFKPGCIIVIDPTGRATDGSFVLAELPQVSLQQTEQNTPEQQVDGFTFRQLRQLADGQWQLRSLNGNRQEPAINISLNDIIGVVVQRAGTRRSYHKRYD
ncbi:hypothetical protein AB833_31745 [Chromatiales bacterium (ex Bugula neritina AB1)]|nr:hypothetical protein AB833_31745 [Chromatiales bacterium (ex Bugula neritina AB1)]